MDIPNEIFLKEFLRNFYIKFIDTIIINNFQNIITSENHLVEWINDTIERYDKNPISFLEFMKNHSKGDACFSSVIGFFYHHGIGSDRCDYNKALEFYLMAINNDKIDLDMLNRDNYSYCFYQLKNIITGKYLLSLFYYKDFIIDIPNCIKSCTTTTSTTTSTTTIRKNKEEGDVDDVIQNIRIVENCMKINTEYNLDDIYYLLLHIKFDLKDEKLFKKIFEHYKRLSSSDQGNISAQLNLAFCYILGIGTEKNMNKVFEWYLKSVKSGNGNLTSQSCYYQHGISIINEKKSLGLYLKSAKGGNLKMQGNLSYCYQYGIGINIDEKEAFEWYLRSAEEGDHVAQNEIGDRYYFGKGIEKHYNKAFEWYLKSSLKGNHNAQNNLGICYQRGIGINKDEKKAFEWYLKSAEGGNHNAQNELGKCYYFGKGVDKNYNKTFHWYLKSAEGGNYNAQNEIGKFYYFGKEVDKNYNKAFEWYLKSAEGENPDGQYNLGFCYHCGIGCKKNIEKAIYWYKKASDNGSLHAKNAFNNLLSSNRNNRKSSYTYI